MQNIRSLVNQIDAIYNDISTTFIDYQNRRELFCRNGCGKCCLHPDIHASVLEMLPLALHLYDTGQSDSILQKLDNPDLEHCLFYTSTSDEQQQGYCGVYQYRPSICRMFGAAGYPDKSGKPQLSSCQIIKSDNEDALALTLQELEQDPPPMMKDWKSKVSSIDYELSQRELPLNEAVKEALYKVLMKSQYNDDVSL